jgi:hypothetical protein
LTLKDRMHHLIDELPEADLVTAERVLSALTATADSVQRVLLEACRDDKPETEEERQAVEEARDELARGEAIPVTELGHAMENGVAHRRRHGMALTRTAQRPAHAPHRTTTLKSSDSPRRHLLRRVPGMLGVECHTANSGEHRFGRSFTTSMKLCGIALLTVVISILTWRLAASQLPTSINDLRYKAFTTDSSSDGGYVAGSGTASTIPLWTGSTTLGDSVLSQSDSGLVIDGYLNPSASPLKVYGDDRGDGTRYLTMLDTGANPGILTNGWITINGATGNPVPVSIAGETNYMLGVGSDILGPAVVIKGNGGGPLIRGYNGSNMKVFELDEDGTLGTKLDIRGSGTPDNAGFLRIRAIDDHADIWRGNLSIQQDPTDTVVAGTSVGISFQPLASTGTTFYGAAKIAAVRPNATINNQDTDLIFYVRSGSSNYTTETEALHITAAGNVLVPALKRPGSAGGKRVVCVDTTTGQLYASSCSTDCSD